MKRWGFKSMPASHGASLSHRSIGSTGQRDATGKVPGAEGNFVFIKDSVFKKPDIYLLPFPTYFAPEDEDPDTLELLLADVGGYRSIHGSRLNTGLIGSKYLAHLQGGVFVVFFVLLGSFCLTKESAMMLWKVEKYCSCFGVLNCWLLVFTTLVGDGKWNILIILVLGALAG
ncbi:hypothetical protein M9H77_12449 [Catharanthus roseus]|uniref:Uncharacterized protein n=1 Tax=Catharanthus roseus TaxID=4058 RepID=A0ACC0BHG6_CATRO|nr:hypothetical protein M9H77_12449 [Catharanthus roseus]